MDARLRRADRPFRDEHAVSEVLGVIMLLAMVMTIMAKTTQQTVMAIITR